MKFDLRQTFAFSFFILSGLVLSSCKKSDADNILELRKPPAPTALTCDVRPGAGTKDHLCALTAGDATGFPQLTYVDDGSSCADVSVDAVTGGISFTAPSYDTTCSVRVKAYDGTSFSNAVSQTIEAFAIPSGSFGVQLGATTTLPIPPANFNQGQDSCSALTTDVFGNTYCAGYTNGALGEPNGGSYDAVVMKFDVNGVLKWVTQLGSLTKAAGAPVNANQGSDQFNAVAVDLAGNVYASGYTNGSVGEVNAGSNDSFFAKFSPSGALTWVRQLGAVSQALSPPPNVNQGDDRLYGVGVDMAGSVYGSGFTVGAVGEPNGGSLDALVIKLNQGGILQWATQLGSLTREPGGVMTANQGSDACYSLTLDGQGNVYCAGHTNGSLGEANGGSYDAFVLKITPAGNVLWVSQLGAVTHVSGAPALWNQSWDTCNGLAIDHLGYLFCGGTTQGVVAEASGGSWDALILKFDANGSLIWGTQFGASTKVPGTTVSANQADDRLTAIASDPNGDVIAAGNTTGEFAEPSGGSGDSFVVKVNSSSGALQWGRQYGSVTRAIGAPGTANQAAESTTTIDVDLQGNVIVGGRSNGIFGEANAGGTDVFLYKRKSDGSL